MARIIPSAQLRRFRAVLVYCYLFLGFSQLVAAFVLAWLSKSGSVGFLFSGIAIACFASVVATTEALSVKDLAVFRKIQANDNP
jgi:hypothetical protein